MQARQDNLEALLERARCCGVRDARSLLGRIRAAQRRASPDMLTAVERDLLAAEDRVRERALRVPSLSFSDELPICQKRDVIRAALQAHQVIVVCGETGSGKTTQLPKICLEAGRGVRGMIGHTQPRRIAARAVASRIAQEVGTPLGDLVGYKVRFGDRTSPRNFIKVMTDGILLSETQHDRALEQYDTIIIDEAHERSLNIDFLLGYIKTLLPRRPDLKVIVTSATIDPERFAAHFTTSAPSMSRTGEVGAGERTAAPVPILAVSGRTYPVEVRFRPPAGEDLDERDQQLQECIVRAVDECCAEGPGDILVFLSGEREIRETAETLHEHTFHNEKHPEILPLYARLSPEEQQRVFQQHDRRRIVLATNVAETSLTVPGIRFVIDPGLARINRYSPRTKVQRLEIEPISRASANQRAGRCGRLGPGVCIRLYSEQDFAQRSEFTDPEITRVNLASVILQMAALQLGRVEDFPFVEAPDSRLIKDGYDTLLELNAVDVKGRLTPLGARLARLPVDPRIGRMVLASDAEGCLDEVLVIAAALAIPDPRVRPHAQQDKADAAHALFEDKSSDFLSLLRLWSAWRDRKKHLSHSKLRRWCAEHFLSFVRMREWEDVHTQLAELAGELRLRHNHSPAQPDAIHRAILPGLLSNIGARAEKPDRELGNYHGARGGRFSIFPGSALFGSAPQGGYPWLVAAEVVRTTKVYARTVAPVRPEWIEAAASHLLQRTYSEPRWDRQSGRVVANERVTLFGLELVAKRRVHYGAIDPDAARAIFIHHALVLGELDTKSPFLAHNLSIEDQVHEWEVRSRRTNLLADVERRARFYDTRVPRDIVTAAAFERWRHEAAKTNPRLLFMSLDDLLSGEGQPPALELYPDELDAGAIRLPLSYALDPAKDEDGVTVRIPLDALGQVQADRLTWLVPGHVREKVEALIRGLPKETRRVLPPASPLASSVCERLKKPEGNLVDAVRAAVRDVTTLDVPREALLGVPLPAWMQMRIEVVDNEGRVLASGRDLGQLKALLAPRLRAGMLTSPSRFSRDGIKAWDFGDLPERVELERAGVVVGAYPGLVDARTSVALRLFDTFESAQAATRGGSRRLFMFESERALKAHTRHVPGFEQMALHYATLGSKAELQACVEELVADRAFIGDMLPVRTEKEFAFRTTRGIERLGPALQEVLPLVSTTLQLYHSVERALSSRHPPAFARACDDMRRQLRELCPKDFLVRTPFEWLRHHPRYLQAMLLRFSKLQGGGVHRDARASEDILALHQGLDDLRARQKELHLREDLIEEYRWMLEELRVSTYAQELRTSMPVSVRRMQEQWARIVRP